MTVYHKCPKCGDNPTFEPEEDIFLMCPCGWTHPEFDWTWDGNRADELPELD